VKLALVLEVEEKAHIYQAAATTVEMGRSLHKVSGFPHRAQESLLQATGPVGTSLHGKQLCEVFT